MDTTAPLKHNDKVALWAEAAVPVLQKVASEYGGYIYYQQFADKLFEETGVTTTQSLYYWIGKPLGVVLDHCTDNGLPALSALVVHAHDGRVGKGFNTFLRRNKRPEVEDPLQLEWVAAEERLKCYRLYCDNVPEDAVPMLTRQYQVAVDRRTPKLSPPPLTCGACAMQLPASGQCDYCS